MPDDFRERNLLLAEKYYWEQSDSAKTIKLLHKMLADDPTDPEVLSFLAFVLYRQNEYDEAERLCMLLLFRAEYSVRAKLDLGRIAFARGKKNQAARWFSECLQEHPNNPITLAWYARAGLWGDLTRQAAFEAEKMARKNPQILSIVFFAYHEQEQTTVDERRILTEMLENLSANAQVYFNLYIFEKENDKKAAYLLLQQYKDKYPEDTMYDLLYASYEKELAKREQQQRDGKQVVFIICIIMILAIYVLSSKAPKNNVIPVFSGLSTFLPVVPEALEPYLPETEYFSRDGQKKALFPNIPTATFSVKDWDES